MNSMIDEKIEILRAYLLQYEEIVSKYITLKKNYNKTSTKLYGVFGFLFGICAILAFLLHYYLISIAMILVAVWSFAMLVFRNNKSGNDYEKDIKEYALRMFSVPETASIDEIMEKVKDSIESIREKVASYDRVIGEKREQLSAEYERICGKISVLEERLTGAFSRRDMLEEAVARKNKSKQKMEAAIKAKETIEGLVVSNKKSLAQCISESVHEYVDVFTAGAHKGAIVLEDFSVRLEDDGEYRDLAAFSQGTVNQVNLGVRFAIKQICGYNIPMFFDEAFACYDDRRIMEVLDRLTKVKDCQMFIFTCTNRETAILERFGKVFEIWEIKRKKRK